MRGLWGRRTCHFEVRKSGSSSLATTIGTSAIVFYVYPTANMFHLYNHILKYGPPLPPHRHKDQCSSDRYPIPLASATSLSPQVAFTARLIHRSVTFMSKPVAPVDRSHTAFSHKVCSPQSGGKTASADGGDGATSA